MDRSRLDQVLEVGVHFKRPREGEAPDAPEPRKTYKWGYYELDAPPLVEDRAYREDVWDFPNPYMSLDANGPKRRKEERDEWVREKRAQRAQMPTPPETIEWHGYQLDEPPLEEDDEYMRDIEGYGPWYASMDADGQKRAKEGRDAYVRKVRAQRAEMAKQRETSERRADEAVPAYPDDAELPSIYWRDPYPEEPEPPRWNHNGAAASAYPDDDEPPDLPRYRPVYPEWSDEPRYRSL